MRTRRQETQPCAFTLLEVMLAIVVAAFVLIAINGVFFGALRLRTRTTASIEKSVPIERALGILQRDLQNVVPPGGTLSGAFQTTTTSFNQETNSVANPAQWQLGQVGPSLQTATGILEEDVPWPEVQRVTYLLREPTNRTVIGRDLYRSVTRNLLSPTVQEPALERLLGGVEDLTFRFYDGSDWRTYWDSATEETPLPKAVRVELQLAAEDKRSRLPPLIELVVPILVDGSTNAATDTTSSSAGGSL